MYGEIRNKMEFFQIFSKLPFFGCCDAKGITVRYNQVARCIFGILNHLQCFLFAKNHAGGSECICAHT